MKPVQTIYCFRLPSTSQDHLTSYLPAGESRFRYFVDSGIKQERSSAWCACRLIYSPCVNRAPRLSSFRVGGAPFPSRAAAECLGSGARAETMLNKQRLGCANVCRWRSLFAADNDLSNCATNPPARAAQAICSTGVFDLEKSELNSCWFKLLE